MRDLERVRSLLEAERRLHLEQAAERVERLAQIGVEPSIESDWQLERELLEDLDARGRESVAEIEAALERLATGQYGRCERCARAIAPARLVVIPHTRFCVSCQAARNTDS